MGEHLSILDSLIVTFVSMFVVFSMLVLISFLISGLKVVCSTKEKDKPKVVESKTEEMVKETFEESQVIDEEIVAVIAAAVASNMGLNIPDVNIKSIKRISQSSTLWGEVSKREQIFRNFN